QVGVLVDGARAQRRPDVIADEFFAQIFDVSGRGASSEGLLASGFQVFLLADVADDGDDFAAVVLLQPGNDDGGVEPSGVRKYNFLGFAFLRVHNSSLAIVGCQAGAQHAAPLQRESKKVRYETREHISLFRTKCAE